MFRKGLTEFRVGIFVSLGLFLIMLVVFTIGSQSELFERQYTLFANFENISGLRIGAPVQLAGLKIGFVDKIKFSEDMNMKEITVVLHIKKNFQDRIREDSVATIETQGLLGDKFIYISLGSEDQPVLSDDAVLQTKATTSIFSLAEKAGQIMEDIGVASRSLSELMGTVRGKKGDSDLKTSMSSIRKSLEQIEKGKGLMHALIYDPKGEEIIASLSDALSSVQENGGKNKKTGVIANLKRASADLNDILDSVKNGQGTLGKLVNDPALYDDLRALLGRASRNKLLRAVIRSTLTENDKQMVK